MFERLAAGDEVILPALSQQTHPSGVFDKLREARPLQVWFICAVTGWHAAPRQPHSHRERKHRGFK